MIRVNITVIDPIKDIHQSASICEPVDETKVIDNALMRFGLTVQDLDIITNKVHSLWNNKDVTFIQGIVKEGTKIVNVIAYDC